MRGRPTVLLVEDDPALCRQLGHHLGRIGYMVVCAATAAQGIQMFELGDADFEAVVANRALPGMSGMDFLRYVCERIDGSTRLVMISSIGAPDGLDSLPFPVTVLPKPIELDALSEAVEGRRTAVG